MEKRKLILQRSQIEMASHRNTVSAILKKVQIEGDEALLKYSKKYENIEFSHVRELKVEENEFEEAEKELSDTVKKAITRAYQNIYNYHSESKMPTTQPMRENGSGVFIGSVSSPIDSVGLYVPRGKGSFPSMTYMLGIPASIAKVPRVVMVTPPLPNKKIDPACLYAAKLCGIHEIYKLGGAHAIAALAYGSKSIAPVNKILGPGSPVVSVAKLLVHSLIHGGLPAGPSESIIIADGSTPAILAAYDLCIEAEHGKDSMALLLTHKEDYAKSLASHLHRIISSAPGKQKEILQYVFKNYGSIILTESEQHSADICNEIAPEHLLLHSSTPGDMLKRIRNAGEILLGRHSPFSIANYIAGPNAVLPTGGMAKSYSAISVGDFMKSSSIIQVSQKGFEKLSPLVQTLAEYEGFYFHKKALEYRDTQINHESRPRNF